MPSDVNDVRALLGLEPFSSEDLAALFRKGGPKLSAAPAPSEEPAPADETATDEAAPEPSTAAADAPAADDLVERLAARIARADAPKPADTDDADRAKAAAIARARRKTMARQKLAARNALKAKADARADTHAPRDMQERLSREFEAYSDNAMPDDEFDIEPDAAPVAENPEPHDTGDAPDIADAPTAEAAPETPINPEPETNTDAQATAETPAAPHHRDSHMTVPGATARFKQAIRVSSPELIPDEDIGDLYAEEDTDVPEQAPVEEPAIAGPQFAEPQAAAEDDAADDAIPEPMSSAQWVEESFAVETPEEDEPRRKSFLERTIIPYSALRPPKYFWPRAVRNKKRKRAE
jgi:hypothetical protein